MSFKKKFSNELVKGSLVLFISMNLLNFLNYFFHFLSARLLTPADYGIVATLMSIIFILYIPNEVIQTIVSRYTTKFNVKKNNKKIKNLMIKSIRKFLVLGVLCFIIFTILSPLIGTFLSIDVKLLMLTGVFIIASFLIPITRGILQGTKKFNSLGINYFLEGFVKVILAFVLIFIGLKVYGAISAVILSVFFVFGVSFLSLKKVLKTKRKKGKVKGIYSYSVPTLISISSIMILLSMDIILAKRFFPEEIVGQYAVLSMLSKIIFFGTWGVSKAMFPLVSEKHDKKRDSKELLMKSFIIVLGLAGFALFLYYFIPRSIITILFGRQYIAFARLLLYPAVAMSLLSVTNIFVLYNLSTGKEKNSYIMVFFVILQIVLLSLFHSTLLQFTKMLILANVISSLTMLILTLKR